MRDIDNLTDPRKLERDSRFGETGQALRELAANGVAEFRFSFFHIIELAHTTEAAKPFALRRVELVKTLRGKRAFLNPDRLWRFEALSLARENRPVTKRRAILPVAGDKSGGSEKRFYKQLIAKRIYDFPHMWKA